MPIAFASAVERDGVDVPTTIWAVRGWARCAAASRRAAVLRMSSATPFSAGGSRSLRRCRR